MLALPRRVRKEIRIWPRKVIAPRKRKKYPYKLFSMILDLALNQEVYLMQEFY